MGRPPEYLMGVLHSIESEVVKCYKEFSRLADKDVEWIYDQLFLYYKSLARGKEKEEPLSTSDIRQAVIDEILNKLDLRKEEGLDDPYIGKVKNGTRTIDSLATLYELAFKTLRSSARFWRKRNGRTGYLDYILEYVVG
ncbi:MAG: hypothetical protein AAFP82_06570 [Bacteroidota bacterium]